MGKIGILFRPTTEADLKTVLKFERDKINKPFIRQWTIDQHLNALSDENVAHLTLETTEDRRVVGYIILVGLKNRDESIEFKRLVINEKGKGFGRQAMRLIKKYAFEKLGAHRLWLDVIEINDRAFKLYLSEGFVIEGKSREAFKYNGKFYSVTIMSILENEYNNSITN